MVRGPLAGAPDDVTHPRTSDNAIGVNTSESNRLLLNHVKKERAP